MSSPYLASSLTQQIRASMYLQQSQACVYRHSREKSKERKTVMTSKNASKFCERGNADIFPGAGGVTHTTPDTTTAAAPGYMPLRLLWSKVFGLEDRWRDRRPSTISVVSHLSEDRLDQLNGLCQALSPGNGDSRETERTPVFTLCVAILASDKKGSARVFRAVRCLPGIGQLILRVKCFTRASSLLGGALSCRTTPPEPCWYPINQLRNRALAEAKTDLVLICDIDFRPCRALLASDTTTLLKRASSRLNCIVLPAFEVVVRSDGNGDGKSAEHSRGTHSQQEGKKQDKLMPDDLFWSQTLESKQRLLEACARGHRVASPECSVVPFASKVWPQGHRATNFDKWETAEVPYKVAYEEGFEPFVIMHRLLVPAFDERFEGYGRNKVIFFYRLHALGFSFTVDPDLFLVHAPHAPSDSWCRTFGREARDVSSSPEEAYSERFTSILEQYGIAKREIDEEFLRRKGLRRDQHRAKAARRFLSTSFNGSKIGSWSAQGAKKLDELGSLGATTGTDVVGNAIRHAVLSSMHALWYEYHPKGVEVVARLESRLGRNDHDVTIFTQCSFSRLNRLERICNQWTGVISAAIITEGGGHLDGHTQREIAALHARIESGGKCRLDISLCQDAPGMATGDGLYPANSLRNVALREARTDLVLSLDIDSVPMAGLHEIVSCPLAYRRLHELCRGGMFSDESDASDEQAWRAGTRPAFVVIPAMEVVGASSPDDPRIHALLQEGEDMKGKAATLVLSGNLQAFHAGCFPEGHRQTNLDRWAALPADAAPYNVKYAERYEPYGFFLRRNAPPFDERFRGFGLDKVSHIWHLHRLGWSFRALPSAFLIDLPHPPTKHRNIHKTRPAFRASVEGLFQRFTAEVDRSIAVANPVPLPSSATKSAGASRVAETTSYNYENHNLRAHDGSPRDYEVLSELSLLAWGDAWMAASPTQRSSDPLSKYCGGGWNMKGHPTDFAGWRGTSTKNSDNDGVGSYRLEMEQKPDLGHDVDSDDCDIFNFPPRMVGGWAHVRVGGHTKGEGEAGDDLGLYGRSVIQPSTLHGVMRYWVRPRWDPKKCSRGKLPGLGMSGDVRLFVRWHSGSIGFCSLMMLGRPLQDICEVHVVHHARFLLERNRTTSIQLEADMRRTPDNGGALSFRAWSDGYVVYEARVYASDTVVSADQRKGMMVEDALLHVFALADAAEDEEISQPNAAAQHVSIGGVEIWGRYPVDSKKKQLEELNVFDAGGQGKSIEERREDDSKDPLDVLSPGNLRFIFVASTGRCGTHFLSKLLTTARGVVAFHEATPNLSGHRTLLEAATAPEESYAKRRHKATDILRSARRCYLLQNESRKQAHQEGDAGPLTYVETSHLFLKTFSDVVMRELAPHFEVNVVVLRRDPAATLKSRIELGHFCGRNKQSDWLLLPPRHDLRAPPATSAAATSRKWHGSGCENNQPVLKEVEMDGFEALIAYAALIEADIRTFRRCYEKSEGSTSSEDDGDGTVLQKMVSLPHPPPTAEPPISSTPPPLPSVHAVSCNIVETSLEVLQTEPGVRKLFADLDLMVSEDDTWRVVEAGATNTRKDEKHRTVPLEYCRQRILNTCWTSTHLTQKI